MNYKPHKALSELAHPSSSLLRLGAGVILFIAVFLALAMLLNEAIWAMIPAETEARWAEDLEMATTPIAVLISLYSFGITIIALALCMRVAHRRSWISTLGAPTRAFSQFIAVTKGLLIFNAVLFLLPSPEGLQLSLHMALGLWLLYLPLTLIGVLIQTSAEELVFRGYLQSQLAARFKSAKVWIVLPSLLFGMLHFNPNVDETAAWIVVVWAFCFGLAAADLTARTGTLGAAIALHFVNNAFVMAFVAAENDFDGAALFTMPFDISDTDLMITWMPIEFMILLCGWLIARLACRV
ncbi:MAG: lysostaphin resistance A-like protein [Roseovarius sp.]